MLKRRLNIRQKCSLIIGCLLAFELVLLFFLDRALVDAERDLWQASIARAIALEGAMLQTTFTEKMASAVAQRILNNDQAPVDTSGAITRIAEQVRSLRLLIQSTPNPDKALARLAKLEKRLLQFVGLTATNGANPTELMFGMNNMEMHRRWPDKRSTVIASQVPIDNWHDVIGDPTIADAILDRLVHNAYKLNLKAKVSMRKGQFTEDIEF